MIAPSVGHFKKLRRLARYLIGVPRVVWRFNWQMPFDEISTYTDSDWAGCRVTTKSTSRGAMMLGSHCLRTWSTTQKFVTLSSAEAELMALVKASTEAIGMSQLGETWGMNLRAAIYVDSSAALAITQRRGCGKLRHVRIGNLWVQQATAEGTLRVQKFPGAKTPRTF